MGNTLFGETTGDLFFEVSYHGPTFEGAVMEIGALSREVAGLKTCLGLLIKNLKQDGKIDFGLGDIEILVEAFREGSFKKKIKFLAKTNKHFGKWQPTYVAVSTVVMALCAVITIIRQYSPQEINQMSPQLMVEIADKTRAGLLADESFKKSLADIVYPLNNDDDKIFFNNSLGQERAQINMSDGKRILELAGAEPEEEVKSEVFIGRISEMDVDASKNQLGFKIDGRGSAIPCSISITSDVQDFIPFLSKWVQVGGVIMSKGKEITHIDIENISEIQLPKQEKIE